MRHRTFIIVTLAILSAVLLQKELLAADIHGNIEVGVSQVGIDSPSSKFMEYGGTGNNGSYLSGGADLSYNDNNFYLNLFGKDLGLDTREVRLESGKHGRYRFYIEYDQLPHYISNNSKTIFDGTGSANLKLPTGFDKGTSTTAAQMNNLSSNLKDVELKLERKDMSTGFSMTTFKGLVDFSLNFKRDEKDGIKSLAGPVSRAGSVVLPEPVDYTTDELSASVAYNRESAQLQLEYYLSTFNNANDSLKWEHPFSAAVTATNTFGAYGNPATSLPPDNRYERVTLSGGATLPMQTRLSITAEYGKMTQDQAFMPYHANSASTADAAGNYPRMSADAAVETKLLNVNLSSRPVSGLGVSAGYRHYDTLNMTPIGLYRYPAEDGSTIVATGSAAIDGDIGTNGLPVVVGSVCTAANGSNPCYRPNGAAALNSSSARYNMPFDYVQDQTKVDLSYRVAGNTILSAGYINDVKIRSHRESGTATEDSYKAGIKTYSSQVAAGGDYLKSVRRSGDYNGAELLDSYTQDYFNQTLNTGANARTWLTIPSLRMFDVADRNRENYNAFVTLFPLKDASLGVNFSHGKDDFTDTIIGLKDSKNETYTIDATVTPSETVSMYAYYTNSWSEANQAGRAITGTASTWTNTTLDWSVNNVDRNDTVGAGLNLQFLRGKLTINPDYTFSKSKTETGVSGGSSFTGATAIQPLPDLNTERHTLNVSARYKVTENVTLGAGYLFEKYMSSDWATDYMTLNDTTTLPTTLIPLSGSVPDYTANMGTVSIAYRF